ncbi:hypothetical protein GGI17_006150 [Coemansia sp. S146]|nr:hypothetical protein GGI17_006150 [Coemansia sp. S146]
MIPMPPTGTNQPLISKHEQLELSAASVLPAIARHLVGLVSLVMWETVDSHVLGANKHIAAIQTLTLDAVQTATGCKQHDLCVGQGCDITWQKCACLMNNESHEIMVFLGSQA